jgi:hypothetical protein
MQAKRRELPAKRQNAEKEREQSREEDMCRIADFNWVAKIKDGEHERKKTSDEKM